MAKSKEECWQKSSSCFQCQYFLLYTEMKYVKIATLTLHNLKNNCNFVAFIIHMINP